MAILNIKIVCTENERTGGRKGQPPELTRKASQPWWRESSVAKVAETHIAHRLTCVPWMQHVEVRGL